jgi:gamma-glutamyltranspeptidase/glutathione hydrolase
MKLEDLAECEAEVIQPIKYEYKAKDGQDGVSLWEVRLMAYHSHSELTR